MSWHVNEAEKILRKDAFWKKAKEKLIIGSLFGLLFTGIGIVTINDINESNKKVIPTPITRNINTFSTPSPQEILKVVKPSH